MAVTANVHAVQGEIERVGRRDGLGVGRHEIGDAHARLCHHGNLAVTEKKDIARVFEDCGNVGSDKVFAVAKADHHGRAESGGNDRVRLVSRQHR